MIGSTADLRSFGLAGAPPMSILLVDPAGARAVLRADPALDAAITAPWPVLTAQEVVEEFLATHPEFGRERGAPWTAADLALLDEARESVDGPLPEVYGHIVTTKRRSSPRWISVPCCAAVRAGR